MNSVDWLIRQHVARWLQSATQLSLLQYPISSHTVQNLSCSQAKLLPHPQEQLAQPRAATGDDRMPGQAKSSTSPPFHPFLLATAIYPHEKTT